MASLVSFLIPAYNHFDFIKQCLDSVLDDSYEDKELVIVDDGSTDGTRLVIEQWIDAHSGHIPIKFRSRENKGIGATLNELISMASGSFIRLGASDDYFLPDGTCQLVDYLLLHPDKKVVVGDSIVVDSAGQLLYGSSMEGLHRVNKQKYVCEDSIVEAVICNWAISGPAPMLRREVISISGGWDESLRIDDWDFFLKVAEVRGLGFIDFPVCAYRVHASNTCRVSNAQARIRNLEESREVAVRRLVNFSSPYNYLLHAQCSLIDAKISYLKFRPLALLVNLLMYMVRSIYARTIRWKLGK